MKSSEFDSSFFLELIGWLFAGSLAGVTAAAGWFQHSKRKLYDRIEAMEKKIESLKDDHGEHVERMIRVETCQENTSKELSAINTTTRDTNKKLDKLIFTITNKAIGAQEEDS
jgi:hypothetical protein